MKRYSLAVVSLLALGLSGCVDISNWRTVNGSGQVLSERREVSGFDRVSIGGSGDLTLTQGDDESLVIETDDNLLPLIQTVVSGGELKIGWRNVNLRPSHGIHFELKVKNLSAIDLSGSLRAQAGPVKTDRMEIHISGSGKVQLAKLQANELGIHVSGSGDTLVNGKVDRQRISISGSGTHRAVDLSCNEASVEVSGSGHATLWVRNNLKVSISGSGDVNYYGNPSVSSHTSGSGHVRNLGTRAAEAEP